MYRLQFLNGKFKGKRLTIQQGSVLIGRDPECQIDLDDDDEVSRHHAVIEYRGGSPVIRDLGAKNPVEVNQQPVKEHRLRNGDQIEIGRTVIEYLSGSGTSPPVHRHRFSKMQAVSFAAIALIVLLQVLFVILFPLWQKKEVVPVVLPKPVIVVEKAAEPAKAERPPPAPPPVAEVKSAATEPVKVASSPPAPRAVDGKPAVDARPTAVEQVKAPAVEKTGETATIPPPVPVGVAAALDASPPAEPVTKAAPLPVAVMPVPAATTSQVEEVKALREQVSDLRKQYEELTTTSPPDDGKKEPEVTTVAVDPLIAKARDMLIDARAEISRLNYVQADNILERAQMLAPNFSPVWRERAQLYERRGMLREAGEQWQQVMTLAAGTPLYKEAADERQRVAQLEARQKQVSAPLRAREEVSSHRLAKRIRITGVERERFQENEEFDEMRLIRITLRPRNNEGPISTDQVLVVVNFYDRLEGTDRLMPTRALVPVEGIRIEGAWGPGESKSVTAAYIVKKGFRAQEMADLGEKRTYEGYRVSVYYKNQLQDESAMPRRIMSLPMPPLPAKK